MQSWTTQLRQSVTLGSSEPQSTPNCSVRQRTTVVEKSRLHSLRGSAIPPLARTNLAPELPTAREQGYDLEMSSLRGLVAPKGIPAEVRERLVKAVAQSVTDPEFRAQAAKFFAPMRYLAPADYEALVRDADVMYRAMWREMPWADK